MTQVTTVGTLVRIGALCAAVSLAACGGDAGELPPIRLLSPDGVNHINPVYAPDGGRLAYWAQTTDGWDLILATADRGEPRVIATSPLVTTPAVWAPDGKSLAYASSATSLFDVWLAGTDGGEPRQLTEGGGIEVPWQWHPRGDRLSYFETKEGGTLAVRVLALETGSSQLFPGTDARDLRIGWWSPDGTKIVYTVQDERGLWTIWLADSAGQNGRQLTTEGFESPADKPWSPSGTELLYVSTRTGTGDVFVYPVEGNQPRQLTRDVRADQAPAWSPDGRWVAFRSERGRQTDVWIVPATGGTELRVTDDVAEESDIQWIPGTTRLAFTTGTTASGLWTLSLADGAEQRLTPDSIRVGSYDLSRDRTQLVYQVVRGGGVSDLMVVPAAGGPSRTLVAGGAEHWTPKWSPDGSKIAFLSNRAGNWDAWVVDATGGEPRRVTDWPTDEWTAEWTADGAGLYVISPRDATPLDDLWLVPLAGGEPRRLTRVGTLQGVVQSPVTSDVFVTTFGGREGRFVLSRLLPDGRLETLWDRSNVMDVWARGIKPPGDSLLVDAETPGGSISSMLIPAHGGHGRQILGDRETAADWSPDGTRLLFYIGGNTPDLAVLNLGDGTSRRLTETPEDEGLVRWTADGQSVVFRRRQPRQRIATAEVGELMRR